MQIGEAEYSDYSRNGQSTFDSQGSWRILSLQQRPDRFWAHSVSHPVDVRKLCTRQQVTKLRLITHLLLARGELFIY
jgi:hypothetical protein